mmetsp:Transcript_17974/g.23499  ORF Transcript_17974/g.23499 Transcript_17974/m.23499 type:complete len:474 (-) Transcript_17974:35-1456(-)
MSCRNIVAKIPFRSLARLVHNMASHHTKQNGSSQPLKSFDRSKFVKNLKVAALQVEPKQCHKVLKLVKPFSLKKFGVRNIVADPQDEEGKRRLVLLNELKSPSEVRKILPPEALEEIDKENIKVVEHEISLGYENFSQEHVLKQLLPESMTEIPSSFETIGHIAHFNLREELMPYRYLIGQVVLDKNAHIKTVVTKTGNIETKFRTFPMEVIAGKEDFNVVVKEHGVRFSFNFAEVYWNSRLQEEHRIVVSRFKKGQVIADAMCGIGPFAVPAAKKGCKVYANDLNPKSYEYLQLNVKKNRVENDVFCYNIDAREFIKRACNGSLSQSSSDETSGRNYPDHIVMNLPASALTFLDALQGAFTASAVNARPGKLPMVHCHCFTSKKDDKERRDDVIQRAETYLGGSLEPYEVNEVQVRNVRDVAPNKFMMCLHFRVPESIAYYSGKSNENKSNEKKRKAVDEDNVEPLKKCSKE